MPFGNDSADVRLQGTSIADSVIDLIGNTPLVRMKRISEIHGIDCVLAMKMETTNPGGSAKDRPALEMILAAERPIIYAGGGDDHTMLQLTVDELLRVTGGEVTGVG